MSNRTDLLHNNSEDLRSRGTSQSSPGELADLPVPDDETAALLSTIIDYGRFASGWNRLPETEQFGMVCAFYLDLTDAGVPRERWMDCYRGWKRRRLQAMRDGKQTGPLSADDLVLEWDSIRKMHAELDKSHLLANPGRDCLRCFGTDPQCPHNKLTPEEDAAYRKEMADKAAEMREALKRMTSTKAMPAEEFKMDLSVTYTCTACARQVKSDFGWNYHDRCNDRLPGPVRDGEKHGCRGVMEVL